MASAWTFQEPHQVEKYGTEKAAWYVGWRELDGRRRSKSFGPGARGKKMAQQFRRKVEAELMTGTYNSNERKQWADFRKEYETRVVSGLAVRSQGEVKTSLAHFERTLPSNTMLVSMINTEHIDTFISRRREDRGRKEGDLVSPATINKDLRHIKAALRVAVEWNYLKTLPRFRMERTPKKLPTYVTGDDFAAIYSACDTARMPEGQPYSPSDWWRALITMGYMTGWRISDMLGLRRADLDLEAGFAITRAEDNKGNRDEKVKLHPLVIEHLRKLVGFDTHVFPWNHNRRTLDVQFARIQTEAGIKLHCPKSHTHTDACHVYGFHDLRRAFATMNADKLTPDALQTLMRHKSYLTTQVYINMSRQMDEAVASLHVPEVFQEAK